MAETFVQFEDAVIAPDGRSYTARACGAGADDGLWDGWIEFDPVDGSPPLRSPRETRQPNRRDLEYWATGLTPVFLEGALERALRALRPPAEPEPVPPPAFDGPAEAPAAPRGTAAAADRPHAVLDPFAVYAQGEEVLRQELSALGEGHLRDVVRAYGLADEDELDLDAMGRTGLAELIDAAVRRRLA